MPRRAALRPAARLGPALCLDHATGRSGLGLQAQREAVARHVAGTPSVIVAEFQEIENGKRNIGRKLRPPRRLPAAPRILGHRQARPPGAQRPFH
jgi:hypothetical protein